MMGLPGLAETEFPEMRQVRGIIAVLVLIVGGGGLWVAIQDGYFGPISGKNGDQSGLGGPFTMTDHLGNPVTERTYQGRHMLVFFGYTFCPDMCPTTLSTISTALDLLGADAKKVNPLFVTIDPARDTPEYLRDYLVHFHPSIIGLTGNTEQVRAIAKGYGVYYAKVQENSADPEDYLMDHTTITYLMNEDGEYAAHFSHRTDPQSMVDQIRAILAQTG